MAGVKHGRYVEHLLGYAVEHGELAGRVKDTAIVGNFLASFKDIAALSREAQWVRGCSLP